jgi:SynChlorMet cassette radical SAM/SPASM protein ScmE
MRLRNPKTFYRANPDISTRLDGNKAAILFHPDSNQENLLNASGLFIWKLLDGSLSVGEISDRIQQHFIVSTTYDQILDEVNDFLVDLAKLDFASSFNSPFTSLKNPKDYPDIHDSPQSVDISITGKCNLHCPYCFYANEMQSRQDLPTKQWLSFFEELGRLAVRDVCLSGGEIFTRPDLWDLIDGIIANRMQYSMLTNGTMITEKTLVSFETGKRRKRLKSIQVSIDGSCPEIHDKSRGMGSFNKAAKGLRLLKEAGFPIAIRVTVNRYNADDLENIARFLLDDVGLNSFSTNDAMPMGAACFNRESITLLPEQQLKAMKTLSRLAKKYNGKITATAGPLAKWHSYKEMEQARATGKKSTRWQMGFLTACGGVFSKLAVHHDGVFSPCNMLSGVELGMMNKDSVKEIWMSHPTLKDLRERRKIPMNKVPGCDDCEWAPYCNGSCPGLAYEMTGNFKLASPHDCYRIFLKETGLHSIFDADERK